MTIEEAKKIVKSECYAHNLLNLDRTLLVNEALDTIIDMADGSGDKKRALLSKIKGLKREETKYDKMAHAHNSLIDKIIQIIEEVCNEM